MALIGRRGINCPQLLITYLILLLLLCSIDNVSCKSCDADCYKYGVCNEELGRCDCPRHLRGTTCSELVRLDKNHGYDNQANEICELYGFKKPRNNTSKILAGPRRVSSASRSTNPGLDKEEDHEEAKSNPAHDDVNHGSINVSDISAPWCGAETPFKCLNACNGRGRCLGGWCHCNKGFYGADCSLSTGPDGRPELLAGQGFRPAAGGPRVYVYELPPRFNTWRNIERYDRTLLVQLMKRLLSSGRRVADPAEADLFFVPVDFRFLGKNAPYIVHYIAKTWPFWNRTLLQNESSPDPGFKGLRARHLFLSTGDLGACETPVLTRLRNREDVLKNVIWITPWGLTRKLDHVWWPGCHRSGHDVVIPIPVQAHHMVLSPLNPLAPKPPRNITFFFAGKICGDGKDPTPAAVDGASRSSAKNVSDGSKRTLLLRPTEADVVLPAALPAASPAAPPSADTVARRGRHLRAFPHEEQRRGRRAPLGRGTRTPSPQPFSTAKKETDLFEWGGRRGAIGADRRMSSVDKGNQIKTKSRGSGGAVNFHLPDYLQKDVVGADGSFTWSVCRTAVNPFYSAGVRQRVFRHHGDRPGYLIVSRSVAYLEDMASSKFCLAPTGGGHGKRQVLVSRFGCVPVVISDHVMQPFEPEMDWRSFSVPVAEADVSTLDRTLEEEERSGRLSDMQSRLPCAARHLWWSSMWGGLFGEDGRYDAFATLMEILRMRIKHPGVDPASYRVLDEHFRRFLDCDLPPANVSSSLPDEPLPGAGPSGASRDAANGGLGLSPETDNRSSSRAVGAPVMGRLGDDDGLGFSRRSAARSAEMYLAAGDVVFGGGASNDSNGMSPSPVGINGNVFLLGDGSVVIGDPSLGLGADIVRFRNPHAFRWFRDALPEVRREAARLRNQSSSPGLEPTATLPGLCTYGFENVMAEISPTPLCDNTLYGKYGIPGGAVCAGFEDNLAACPRPW